MKRWLRILKHRWLDEADSHRALDDAALERLTARVRASETEHGGEIRVCVEAGLPLSYLWRGLSARERARMLFGKLRVWDTEANDGVLIYLLLAERAIEIVCDRAVARAVPQQAWQGVLEQLRPALREGRFEDGLAAAIDAIDALRRQSLQAARVCPEAQAGNELPDRPLRL